MKFWNKRRRLRILYATSRSVQFLQLDTSSVRNLRKRNAEAPGVSWRGTVPNTSAAANVSTSASSVGGSLSYAHLRSETINPDRAFLISLGSSREISTFCSGPPHNPEPAIWIPGSLDNSGSLVTQYFPLELLLQYIFVVVVVVSVIVS